MPECSALRHQNFLECRSHPSSPNQIAIAFAATPRLAVTGGKHQSATTFKPSRATDRRFLWWLRSVLLKRPEPRLVAAT